MTHTVVLGELPHPIEFPSPVSRLRRFDGGMTVFTEDGREWDILFAAPPEPEPDEPTIVRK